MKQLSPGNTSNNLRVFFACLLSFNIFITPIAAIAATIKAKSEVRSQKSESNKAAADDVFAKPLVELAKPESAAAAPAPAALPAPAPLPAAPPVGSVTSSLTASLLAANGGVDADSDGKADPGDTIAYTLSLSNTSGAGATGLAIANPLDSHTTLVPGSLNSTPVAFDQSVSLNEDGTLVITLQGQDPDGSNITFKKSDGTAFPVNPTTIATTHGTIGTFGSVTCDANGVCSQQVTYTPAADYNGPDSFSFKANDGTANSNENGVVSITVISVNDAPTFTVPSNPAAVNEDAGATTVTNYITGIRPAQPGNATEDTQNVSFVITNVTHTALFAAQPALNVSNSGNQPFPLTANLTYTPAANANGTSVVTYHLHDNGGTANGGVDSSADQTFTITVNAVNDAPVAQAKAFTVQANMKITGLAGLLTGVTDPDATNGAADPLSFDAQAGYTTPSVTLTSVTLGTCTNGTISNVQTSGSFDFDPPPGLGGGGTCVLNYQVTDTKNPGPGVVSAAQTITITAQGPVIWFVDPNRTNNGNGTLSNAADTAGNPGPFKTLSSANAKLATLATNQKVFIYTGTTASGVSEVLDLAANNDWLVGQGTVAASFDSFFGLTGGSSPPAGTVTRPTLSNTPATAFAARPTVSGTVTMRNVTQVTGVNIVVAGAIKGLTSAGFTSGTSLIKDVSVTSATGNAVDLSGTQTVTYETSDGTNSPNVLISVGGIALNVFSGVTIGANGFTFKSISANGGTNGIVLNTTGGTAGLTVTGTGTTAGSGGTITNCSAKGADIRSAKNISLSNMNFTNNATANLGASGTCGDALNGTNGPTTCNANISLSSVTTATLTKISATGSKQIGIDVKGGSDLTLTNMTVTGNGNETMEDGVQITDLTGTLTVAGGLFKDNAANQFEVQNGVAGPLSVIVGTSTFSNTAFPTGATTPANTTANSGLFLATHSSAVMNPTITNCIVDRIYAQGIRLDMAGSSSMTANIGPATGAGNGNTITNSNQAISLTGSNTGGFTYNIRNNTANIVPANVAGGATNQIGVARSTASGTWTGLIDNNFVGTAGTANSGCQVAGCDGIDVVNNSAGTHKLSIINNHIHDTEGSGMVIIAGGAPDNSTVSWTVQNNFIDNPDENAGQANPAILIQSGTSVGTDTSKTCLNISGNTISGTWSLGTGHLSSIRVRSLTTAAGSFAIVGFNPATEYPNDPTGVSGSTTGAVGNVGNVADYIRQQNPGVTNASPGQNAASATQGAAVFSNSGGCPLLLADGGVMAALNSPSLISNVFFSSIDIAPAASPASSPITTANTISTSLTQPQLDMLVGAAILRWTVTGLSVEQIASLREIKFEVTDLTNAYLAESSGNRIMVDRSAEGKGWFLDSTPQDDSEFANALAPTRRLTDPQSVSAGHIDLLTAIEHEMGHKLGLGDSYLERDRNDLMYGYLTVGERRLPAKDQASKATPGQNAADAHFLSLVSEDQLRSIQSPVVSRTEDAVEGLGRSQSFSVNMHVVSGMSGDNGVAAEIRGQRAEIGSQKSEVRNQKLDVRLNHAVKAEIKGQKSEVRNHIAGVALVVPTPIGSFPVNGTGAGQGFTLPDGKTITITFKATLNAPPNLSGPSNPKVTAQATLTGSFVGNPLLSDDPSVGGTTDPTSTNVDLYDSTTTLSASPSNSTSTSQAVTFTATIGTSGTPNGSATNRTGTVNFRDNGVSIGCDSQAVSHVGSNDVATCSTSSLTTGVHNNITAAYSGDGNFDPSTSSAFTQTVSKSGTNATLVSSLNPATVTQNITFTFTISSATSVPGPPTGTVTFKDGASTIGCSNAGGQVLNGSGVATCQTSSLSAASHTITADYPGDTNFNASAGVALTASGGQNGNPQVVNKATPSVTLVSSLNPAFVGQAVTFTGTVTAPGGISGAPSGTLTFRDGGVAMTCTGGNQTLSSGVATCQKSNLSAGSHTITVDYPTDANFNAVSGTALTASGGQNGNPQVINQSNTTMTVSSSKNPTNVLESVKFTVNIISSNLGTVPGPPTGQVKFWDGPANTGTQIGVTKTLGSGGTCNANSACVDSDATTSLTAGTHTITVEYLGDSNFTANSANLSGGQVVNKSDTSVSLGSSGATPNVGDSVTFTATVSSSTAITFDDGGTVDFKDGSTIISGCGAKTINPSHQATCTTTALPAGARNITAVYGGDGAFNGSTSNTVVQQVGPACPNSVVVTSAGDNGAGTLRQAIADVCDGGTITFDSTTFPAPGPNFINLIDAGGAGIGGELLVNKNVTINGPAASILTVRRALGASTNFRVFEIGSGTVTITGMTITNGSGSTGGSIFNNGGTANLTNVVVQANNATTQGGGIYNAAAGTLTLTNSTVSNNTSTTDGGGIYSAGALNVVGSTINSNSAPADGGGINFTSAGPALTITNSTISGNIAAGSGGGLFVNGGTATLTGVTITGNHCDSDDNTLGDGGGIQRQAGTVTVQDTIVAGNFKGSGKQVETVTVSGGNVANSGNILVKVTAAGINSGVTQTLTVALLSGDTNAQVATKIQAALQGNASINNFFDITTSTADVVLRAKTAAANDTTMHVSIVASETGINSAESSPTPPPGSAPVAGQKQSVTMTVAGTAACAAPGNITVTVTAAGMTPTTVAFNVNVADTNDAATVAQAIRDYLAANSIDVTPINNFFDISGAGADVVFTAKAAATNDPSMAAAVSDGTCTGVSSTSTGTPGSAGSPGTKQVEKVTVTGAPVVNDGNVFVTVTANTLNLTTGKTIPVALTTAVHTTNDLVATEIANALTNDPDVGGYFDMSTEATGKVVLTRKVAALNDGTIHVSVIGLTGIKTAESVHTAPGGTSATPNDINGTVTGTYNLIGDSNTAGTLTDGVGNNLVGNAGVGTRDVTTVLDTNLADNGGPTRTHKLVSGGPAIDAGNKFTMTTDQRGLQRPVDLAPANASDGSDIGAYEQQGPTPVPTLTLTSTIVSGTTTRDSTPDFSAGNLIVGASVELLRGGVSTTPATTVIATSSTMSLTDNTLTTDGTYAYSVKQTVGGDSQTSTPDVSVTVDTRPTVTALLAADDTGASSSDKITKNTTPRFTGTADLNTSIRLFANNGGGAVQVGTGTSDGSGNWTITSSALVDGTYSVTAKEVFGSFVGAASTPLTGVVIDTQVAAPSTPVLFAADDSGTAGDKITNINTPRITGTAEAGSSVTLFSGATPIGTGTADNGGNWTITVSPALADNTYQVTAQATDVAGNVSAQSSALTNLVIDTQAPAPPSQPDLIATDDTGDFNNDNVTKKTTPTFTGTAEAGSTVKLYQNTGGPDVEIGSTTATGGTWSITSSALTANTYSITAKSTDTAGNSSNASTILTVTIDDQAPNAPSQPDLIAADDTGASSSDNITKKTTPTFNGTAEANSTVKLFADNGGGAVQVGSTTATGGSWSIASSALTDGTYQITATATDLAGNQSAASSNLQVVIDTQPPNAPSTPVLNPVDDTGTSSSDGITKKNTPNFTGTAEVGSTVQLFAGASPVGSGLATGAPGGNTWSITSSVLADNGYSVTAQATDVAGNTSGSSGAFALVIDTVKPTVTMSSATGNPTATALIPVTVQFSEPVAGFTSGDIVPTNGAVSNFAGSNANYSFDLTAAAPGGVSADIAADAATDTAGNGNTAAVQFNRTYDPSALNATITAISPNPRNTAVSSIQIVFNKPVTGFDLGDLTLKLNNGANLLTGAQTLNSADNATWTLGNLAGLTTAEGTYDLKLTAAGSNIKDATNTALASDATASWVMDTTPPNVTVSVAGAQANPVTGPTNTTVINFTVVFGEAVTDFISSGVTLSGSAGATVANVSGSGTTYNVAVNGMTTSGAVTITIAAGVAHDAAGNGNTSVNPTNTATVTFNADNFTTFEVNSLADTSDGQCDALGTGIGNKDCTLREAINAANADSGAETITFAPALTSGGPATIKLLTALPNLSTDMTIQGPGANLLTVMRSDVGVIPRFRVFTITAGTVGISGLTISNGATASGSGAGPGTDGGGLSNAGTLSLSAVTITGNSAGSGGNNGGGAGGAGGFGGGIFNNGTLAINNSTINANNAGTGGDGVVGGAGGSGGGIYHTGAGTLTITNSTISGNQTGVGGSPAGAGGSGGGIASAGTLTLTSSTVTANNATGSGGGLARTAGVTTLQNSIIGANTSGTAPDISGTVQSDGFNLIQSTSGATINQNGGAGPDITGQDPLLNALMDNGGPTFTHALQCTSPAIDKGKAFGAPPDSLRDQRGGTRPFDFADAVYPNAVGGDGSDIGAVETQSAGGCVPTAVPPAVQPTTTSEDTPVQITLTGTYSQNTPLTFSITQAPANGALGAISAPNCNFNLSMTCTATVTYTPAANVSGADLFKFKVSASGLDSDPADVSVSVSSVNDPPTFGITSDSTANEDAGPQTVNNFAFNISPGAANESGQLLQFIVTGNTNPGLFSASPAIDSSGTLTYTSAANANGQATITVVLKDDGGTANGGSDTSAPKTFTITVNSVNDAPTFTLAGTQTVLEDAGSQTVANFATAISVGPPQESGQTAQFIVTNNTNAGMFSSAPAISPTGTLTYTPAPDANGSATITVVLKDNGGTLNGGVDTSAPQTFTINVTSVNDAPTLDLLGDRTINEDAPTQTVSLAGISAGGGETQVLAITATSSNPALIPNPTVSYTSPSTTGSISFTPLADQNGSAIITVTVNDGGGTANGGVQTVTRTFTVTVNAINDAPINNLPGPQTIAENSPLIFSTANANLISINDVDSGASPVRVTLTATNGVITLSTIAGLAFTVGDGTADPTMTFTGTLASINTALQGMTFTPTNGFSGAAALQIITNDQGNTGSGGPMSDTDTLSITVNDGGNLQFNAATYTVSENAGPAVITITRTGGSAGTATVQIATSNGTATAGSDYTAVNQTVTFNGGETSKTVNIPITDDLLNEPDETVNLTLSTVGGSGALGTPATAVLTIADDDPAGGYIKFSSPTYSVAEGGVATITVQRQGTLTQAVTVNFATSDDSDPASMVMCAPTPGNTLASSRCDFTSAFGRITFAAGDGADKTFKVLTTQDSYVEGPETFTVTLSSPTNSATLALPSTATVTITDDAIEPPTNPVDDSNAFVEQLYRDFLNRPSDPAGKAFWVNNIDHCNNPAQRPPGQTAAQCIQLSRIVTAAAFFLSIEFQATGGTAYLTNKVAFGSRPNFARFEQDAQQVGLNYVFGQPGAEALLEANKVAYYNDYVTRTDFVNTYGGVSDQTYVSTLIGNTGVAFTQAEHDAFVNGLANQSETRATVLRKISEKGTFRAAEFNSMFVLMEYYGFLRRNPDTAGFNFWLNKLNLFNGNYLDAEMVKAFIESAEYRQRFGP